MTAVTLSTAERIRVALAEKGWTQTKLAEAVGISQGDISRYCSGKKAPDGRTIDRIMTALGATHTIDAVDGVLGIQGRAPGKLLAVNPLAEAPPVEWVVEGLVARGAVTMVAGQPGAGKSLLTQSLAVAMANGAESVIGCKLHGRHALVIDAENGEHLIQRRARSMGLAEANAHHYSVAVADTFDIEKDKGALWAILGDYAEAGRPVDLIILDSWTSLWTGSETSVEQVQRCLNLLRSLAQEHNVGVLLIHHTDKEGDSYRGSGAIAATIEAVFSFSRWDIEQPDSRVLSCQKMRLDAEPRPRFLSVGAVGVSLSDEREQVQATIDLLHRSL